MPDLVNVTIDDIKVSVPAGTLVVDAAKAAGIEIPVFCSHPKLDPLGACRMCIVEFPGPRGSRLDTACTVRVSEGMVVRTDTEQVKKVREANLGFILINHPLDCPICDKGGECPLQDQTMAVRAGGQPVRRGQAREAEALSHQRPDHARPGALHPVLALHPLPGRVGGQAAARPVRARGDTVIDTFPGQQVDAKTSGNICDICPVGALTNRVSRFRYRPWEIKKTPSVCTLCPVGCNVRLDERVHALRRIVARENMAVNDEWICDKGRFLHQYVDHPDRLKTPLVREGGELRPATWDEALGQIVEALSTIGSDACGPSAIGGVASARVSNEAAYLFQKFFRALVGTNNVDFPDGSAVRAQATGLSNITDIAKSDLIVLVGFDPSEAAPLLDLHIKRAVRRAGAKLLIINPRRIELAKYPGAYLPVLPGNEAVLLNELAVAIQAGKTRDQGLGTRGQGTGGHSPQSLVPSPRYPAAVDLLTAAKSPLFIYGPDAARGERGRLAVTALSNLAIQLGFGDRLAYVGAEANSQGARDMGLLPDALPGHQPVSDAAVRDRLGKLWGAPPPAEPGLSYAQMIGGNLRALYVMGANPAADSVTAEALGRLDFLVVQDLFLTETAQLADVVLPAASFAEAEGTYTNLERRVQRGPQGISPAGESRTDWQILAALAERWQTAQVAPQTSSVSETAQVSGAKTADWKKKKQKAKVGPASKPWNYPTIGTVLDEIDKAVPTYVGIRWETLGEGGLQWSTSALARPARRVEPVEIAAIAAPAAGSYLLVSSPVLWDGGALMAHGAEQVRKRMVAPFVALNPADLAAAGLLEGPIVTVTSLHAHVVLPLRADASVQPGTAWIPSGLTGAPAEMLGAGSSEVVSVVVS